MRVVSRGEVRIPRDTAGHATAPIEDIVAVHRSLEARETTGSTVLTL